MGGVRDALSTILQPQHLRRTITIALVVGTILTAINHAHVIARGDATSATFAGRAQLPGAVHRLEPWAPGRHEGRLELVRRDCRPAWVPLSSASGGDGSGRPGQLDRELQTPEPGAAATATPAGKTVASTAAIVMSRMPSPARRMNVTTATTNPTGTTAAITGRSDGSAGWMARKNRQSETPPRSVVNVSRARKLATCPAPSPVEVVRAGGERASSSTYARTDRARHASRSG
jgi:hypothetical protein